MDWNDQILPLLLRWLPAACVIVVSAVLLPLIASLLERRESPLNEAAPLLRQLIMLALTATAVVAFALALPIAETSRGQLLGLLGLLISAVIALSSTTFVGNAMGGMMLRAVRNFRGGDFIQVGEHMGRVTERGLFHVEIQTEDRDLTTLPNLYLVTHPVKVVRASGTIISGEISLGYDVPRTDVERLLIAAARTAGLEEPFVQVLELADHAVGYRAAGFLPDVRYVLTARSRLRAAMLDALHDAGIEVVSPTFMNQRVLDPARAMIPDRRPYAAQASTDEPAQELMFDKAERAASRESLQGELAEIEKQLTALAAETPPNEWELAALKRQRERLRGQIEALANEDPD